MNEQRILEIKSRLVNYGTETETVYTNQEIVDRLVALQKAMADEVFALKHAESFDAREIMLHFTAFVTEYGLTETKEYRRLAMNMEDLGCMIGSLKKGFAGELRTKKGLQNLSFDPHVRLLYNITLQDQMSKTEYDAIAITPYGIFVVEAKNFSGSAYINEKGMLIRQDKAIAEYNLGEKMNTKEFLLRNCLGDLASVPYHGFLLYVDEKADILDDYKQIPIVFCNTVASTIRGYDKGENHISHENVLEIEKRIMEHRVDSRYPCKVNCKQIIDDFAFLMSEIEERAEAAHQTESSNAKAYPKTKRVKQHHAAVTAQPGKRSVWPQVIGGIALLFSGIAIGRKLLNT